MKGKKETDYYLKLLAKTSIFVFITIAISKLLTYAYKIIIARSFGPEIYGLFSLALVILGFFTTVASLGLPEGLIRYIPYYRGKGEQQKVKFLLRKTLFLLTVSGIIAGILLFVSADFIAQTFNDAALSEYLKVLSIAIPFTIVGQVFLSFLRALQYVGVYSFLMNIFQNLSKVVLLFLLLMLGMEAAALSYSYLISFVLLLMLAYLFSRKQLAEAFAYADLAQHEQQKTARHVYSYSWPLIFVGTLYILFYWTDSLIIAYFEDPTAVGIYNAAVTIVSLFAIAPELFIRLFSPVISGKLSQGKNSLIRTLTQQVSKWIYLLNLPVFVMLFFFPGAAINLIFDAAFLGAENSLRILAISGLAIGFMSLFTELINLKGHSKSILKALLFFNMINFVLAAILVPRIGLEGAAIATTVTSLAFTSFLYLKVRKLYGFSPVRKGLVKITLIMIIPSLFLFAISSHISKTLINLAIACGIFGIVYLILILLSRSLDRNDLEVIHSITRKLKEHTYGRISGISNWT